MSNIVIVGSGIAGDEAAFAAKKTDPGANVIIVTQDPYPLYSACVLADYIAGEIPKKRVFLKEPNEYDKAGIELQLSTRVMEIKPDCRTLKLNGRELVYDKLILAPGSRSFIPPIAGADKKGVYTLKTLHDADSILNAEGKNAVVVGSGPVGIEVCIALHKKGYSVALMELEKNILPALFDSPMSGNIQKMLEDKGIEVKTGERVLEIIGNDHVEKIKTDKNTIDCDITVLVAGMRPEVAIAKKSGMELGESGGIIVNNHMETGKPNIWACGDCVESTDRINGKKGLYMLWSNAKLQGKTAGINAAGGNARYAGSLNVTTVNVFDTGAAAIGTPASKFKDDEVEIIHRKGHRGELWIVLKEEEFVGAQVIGNVEIIGDLLKIFLSSSKKINAARGKQGQLLGLWSLRGLVTQRRKFESSPSEQ